MRTRPVCAVLAIAWLVTACAAPATPAASSVAAPATHAPTASENPTPTVDATPAPTQEPAVPPAWTQLPAAGPPAREDHTWTVDAAGGTAYLFGGRDGETTYGDVWALELATDTWRLLETTNPPPPRFGHEAAWVDGFGLVVFAGQDGPSFFNDLWALDAASGTWRELPATGDVPVARYGTCAAIGPDGQLWISHGFTSDGVRFSDTLAYDFTAGTWTDQTPAGDRPVERCLHGCWWTDDGLLALYGGQTTGVTAIGDRWLLGPEGWTRVEQGLPPDRNLYARARTDAATLVFGGQAVDGTYPSDLWLLDDGGSAAPIALTAGPAGRAGAEMIRDRERGRFLLFGGRGADGALADTWMLTGEVDTAAGV